MRASALYPFITVNTPGPRCYLPVETPWCSVSGECVLTFPHEHSTFHTLLKLLKPELGLPCPHGPLPVDPPSWGSPKIEPSRYSLWGVLLQVCFSINEEYSTALEINYSVLNGNIKTDSRVIDTEVIITGTYLPCTMRQMQIPKSVPGKSDHSCGVSFQFLQSLYQKD